VYTHICYPKEDEMKLAPRISGEERRASIISAAKSVFMEKGFHGTTTRELAEAAGVSEALVFKHFPSKEALYSAILTSCFKDEGAKIRRRLESLKPSTSALVSLVYELVSHVLNGPPDEGDRGFFRLIIRSLMDEGEFTRLAIQGGPSHWVRKVAECIRAAKSAGDMFDTRGQPRLAGWLVHHIITGILLHWLPGESVIDYGVPREELTRQAVRFCLLGMGLKDEAILRCAKEEGIPIA
jgi:AcrR family transcriptional regulator